MMRIKSYKLRTAPPDSGTFRKAQAYIDSEIIRRSDPYVPFRTGSLKRSGITGTKIGTGIIEYTAPYARRQYFEGRSKGLRGRLWARRMWASNGSDIISNAEKIMGEK